MDYNTQVKPLLNKHCISCHGGVKQSGSFSLMTRDLALRETESGGHGIVPGDPEASVMINRILLEDPDNRMPKNAPALSMEEIKILTKWVEQGAKWGLHWAYEPLDKQVQEKGIEQLSGIGQSDGKENALSKRIDQRIKLNLSTSGLSLSARASKSELLRRVSLDLIGMPPSSTIREAFLRAENSISYTELVDQLLASPSFGEKWASMWLDIARYADSRGFERDQSRSIWAYRDYVIKSLNEAKPFDTFIIEQMAGDLIPSPTDEQLIATGFHRNTPTNDEGGTDNEEYRVRAVMDRVSTTWGGLMGTTMACVQCHGHPYDPFPHENFYQTFAFLNNTRDADTGKDYPLLKLLDSLEQTKLEELITWVASVSSEEEAQEISRFVKTGQPAIYSSETDELINADIYDTKYLGIRKNGSARIPNVYMTGVRRILMPLNSFEYGGILTFHLDDPTGPEIKRINLSKKRSEFLDLDISPYEGLHDIYLKYRNPSMASTEKRGVQFDWFYFASTFPGENDKSQKEFKRLYNELVTSESPHTLIMSPNPEERQRKTHLFDRGNWASPTEEVQPDIPEIFSDIQDENQPDRMAFAEWIVNDKNPLTARTISNRVWEQLWGNGIVITTEDLGSQGSKPSHPEALDDIAYTWMHDYNWNLKDLIKAIVTTEAYQQSAKLDAQKVEKDPYNELLSRGPRVRLSAEQIRDQALSISGLLSSKMYGPPVMPIQPSGIWETPYNDEIWNESTGVDKYRRAIYTFIKRSSVYPSLVQFDMSTRSVCESRRIQTNTPLQALVTLNDPAFIECASALAKRMEKEGGNSLAQKINYAYYLGLNKNISVEKSEILENLYHQTLTELNNESMSYENEASDLAMAMVANSILNLDEMLNK
ncbi:MAG: hypothetical protein ACI9FN_001131 [Saprospiraceae bacterium]|jgi:hypothetical protein